MELLRLSLEPIDKTNFNISAESSAGEGKSYSILPFFDNGTDRINTLTKILDAINFNLEHFKEEELDWMIRTNLIKKDRSAFQPDLLVNIGFNLFQALFSTGSEVAKILERAITLAENKQTQLHIQFQFYANTKEACRLASYPWELMHNGQKFLAQSFVTFSRYIAYGATPPNILPVDKINILLVTSGASDPDNKLNQLSDNDKTAIYKGINKARQEKKVSITNLSPPTFKRLRTYLTQNKQKKVPHVIHFDGHGIYGKRCTNDGCRKVFKGIRIDKCKCCGSSLSTPQGYLLFEDDKGEADYISANQFGDLIQQHSFSFEKQQGIFLIVLSACKSAMVLASDSDFNGIAQNLISRQIPAVVAMQYLINVTAATDFAQQFYSSLGQKNPLATVVSQAREAMDFERNQWYRPILYLRWKDNEGGQLFTNDSTSISQNVEQIIEEVSNQINRATVAQSLLEIPRENSRKRTEYRKQAENWLKEEDVRRNLALNITDYVLKAEFLSINSNYLNEEEAQKIFDNLYYCLTYILSSFQAGTGESIDNFINEYLSQHSLEIYIIALDFFKHEAQKKFHNNEKVVNTVHRYTNNLIQKISSYL